MPQKRILICDDEVSLRLLVRAVLNADYEFEEAADGLRGLELARRLKPDLVVLDVMLPGRNGLTLLAELRNDPQLRATPVIVLTASPDYRTAAIEAGADRFFMKPFEPDDLATAAEELLVTP